MNNSEQHPERPSNRKVNYLRILADQTGGSFAYPRTDTDANREINRLKKLKKTPAPQRRRERRQVRDDIARGSGGASRVRADELRGYGSTAGWGQPNLPSEEQLDLLERLCVESGTEFVMPKSSGEARRMIGEFLPRRS